jgi:hypothetical protein
MSNTAPVGLGLTRIALAAVLAVSTAVALPGSVKAHRERPTEVPSGAGSVPVYREGGPTLVVCKPDSARRLQPLPDGLREANGRLLGRCRFRHIQAAVDAVTEPGTRILVLPGVYREEPSLEPPAPACAALAGQQLLGYEDHRRCPNLQNLIAVLGDGPDADRACDGRLCALQIEGTGAGPEDVVVDGEFAKQHVMRADRADGIYLRNFTVQRAGFTGVYVIETDGFAIDRLLGRWTDEYGFLTFSSDHGLYTGCEAYGNGDAGIYPGSAADVGGDRWAIEVRHCRSHHNTLGYSGTAGNSVWVHDNEFFENATGMATDSLFPNHPGLPQNSARFERNRVWSNNADYFRYRRDGTCKRPSAERGYERGVVCPLVAAPVGTGILIAGGNGNVVTDNWIWDNWRAGTMLLWAPAPARGELDPSKLFDTSHGNRFVANRMGLAPDGGLAVNGVDFWWDEEGSANCWSANVSGAASPSSDPAALPSCDEPAAAFSPGNPLNLDPPIDLSGHGRPSAESAS